MKNAFSLSVVALVLTGAAAVALGAHPGEIRPLPPGQVRLGGEMGRRVDITIHNNLLRLDVDGDFLAAFRNHAAERSGVYFGLGKLIDASVSFAAYTRDEKVIAFKDRLVRETIETQLGDGYLGVYRPGRRVFVYWDLHEMVYIIYGLVNNYRRFQHRPSLEAARKLADYIMTKRRGSDRPRSVGKLNTERAFLALAGATGERKYLDYAVGGMDLRNWSAPVGGHAYTYMNVCLAQLDLYEKERTKSLLNQSRRVIEYLTARDGLVVDGACSRQEGFHTNQDGSGALGETCAVAYLLRLLDRLMQLEPKTLYGDLMERAIYNALFAAQAPDGRRLRYFTCFEGPRAYYGHDTYCCPNNFRRIVAELPGMVAYRSTRGITVNLYTASSAAVTLRDGARVELRQETDYPNSGTVLLRVAPAKPVSFTLQLRIPRWCRTATVFLNGETGRAAVPGGFFEISRGWRPGDRVRLEMPMQPRLVRGRKKQRGKIAVLRGPVLFCLDPARNEKQCPILGGAGAGDSAERTRLEARIREVEGRLGPLEGRPVNLADIVAGGNGFGGAAAGRGIDPRTGKNVGGAAGMLDCRPNVLVPAESPFVDGIAVPDGSAGTAVPISSTGLAVDGLPDTSGRTWDHLKSGPVKDQYTTEAGGIDHAAPGRSMLSIHANKAVTFDLAAIRKATGYRELTFRTVIAYGGRPEPTVDVAVLVDAKYVLERTALSRKRPIVLRCPLAAERRFLTIVVTDQNKSISSDQVFLGDPVLLPQGWKATGTAKRRARLTAELRKLRKELAGHLTCAEVMAGLVIDPASLAGPFPDTSVRPDGQALRVKAWSPGCDSALPADLTLTLTEFPDPGGQAVYFVAEDPGAGVEDELVQKKEGG